MEKVVFREVTFSFPSTRKIQVSHSEQLSEIKILDWCQVFFFTRSVLIAKVFRSNLILSQFFICSDNFDLNTIKTHNSNLTVRISLPQKILPSIHCEFFNERFQLLVPVFPNQLFQFTLNQDLTIREDSLFEKNQIFNVDCQNASCFSFVRSNLEDFEVCYGLNDGRFYLASFKYTEDNEPGLPNNIKQIDPPSSLYKKVFTFLLKSQKTEKLIRVVKVNQNLIISLNNFGVLRLYDLIQHSFLAETNLELPEIFENKFVTFTGLDGFFLGLGYCKDYKIWVYIIRVKNLELVLESLFVETGILHDIAINQDGLWIAFGDYNFSKIILKPFAQTGSIIYSYHDQVKEEEITDQDICEKSKSVNNFKQRIFNSGRFKSHWILETFRKVSKNEEIQWEDLHDIEGFSYDVLKEVLDQLKFLDSQSKEIWALGVCSKVGEFPLFVIRGNEKVGILRKIEDKVETWDVTIKKLASDCNYLKGVNCERDFRVWKISFGISGLDLALLLIRVWRQEIKTWNYPKFSYFIETALKNPIPSYLLDYIKRLIPAQLEEILFEDLDSFLSKFNDSIERSQIHPNTSWSRFTLQSFGASVTSMIDSNLDYFIDTSILLALVSRKYLPDIFIEFDSSLIHDFKIIGSYLYSLKIVMMSDLSTYTKALFSNSALKTITTDLDVFSFPSTVSSLYIYSRSYLLLGANDNVELINYSFWKNNSLRLVMSDLATFIDDGVNSRSFGKYLKNCFRKFRIFPVNLINLMSFFGLSPVVSKFFESFDDSLELYYTGVSHINEGRILAGEKELIRSKSSFLSGSEDFNEKVLYSCPIELLPTGIRQDSLSRYESGLHSQLKTGQKSLLVLSQIITSSIHVDFSQETLELFCKSLSENHSFHECYSIIQFNQTKKTLKQILQNMIQEAVHSNKFPQFLDLKMDFKNQEIVSNFLKKKSLEERIDIYSLITWTRFKEQTASLFLDTFTVSEREQDSKNEINWIDAYYCFSMKNFRYADAASAAYRGVMQIETIMEGFSYNSHEFKFLNEVMEEFLLMVKLAARNISPQVSNCWFLVEILYKKKLERNLVTFEQINRLWKKYSKGFRFFQ